MSKPALDTLQDILREETADLPPRVAAVCDMIEAKHEGCVLAFIYYGSSLRELDNPEKMLDFYVIVESYRKTHKNLIRAGLNALIPPAVYYLEREDADGVISTCKYSILSLKAFERRCSERALLSQVWGRFAQPCALLRPKSDAVTARILTAREAAIRHMAAETIPLLGAHTTPTELWGRAFYESYRTELRPESSRGRSEELAARYEARYRRITEKLYGVDPDGEITLPETRRSGVRFRWFLRRFFGKPATAIRVLNSAATFDGGLDYVLRKVQNHSGVTIEPSAFQRKHPVLCSPVLGWKLWRKGAFG
jgi:hypothetical protein